jgi:GDP-D-mannose dehydratase
LVPRTTTHKAALITGVTGQDGAYLGEDDIVRFEDSYGRG